MIIWSYFYSFFPGKSEFVSEFCLIGWHPFREILDLQMKSWTLIRNRNGDSNMANHIAVGGLTFFKLQ